MYSLFLFLIMLCIKKKFWLFFSSVMSSSSIKKLSFHPHRHILSFESVFVRTFEQEYLRLSIFSQIVSLRFQFYQLEANIVRMRLSSFHPIDSFFWNLVDAVAENGSKKEKEEVKLHCSVLYSKFRHNTIIWYGSNQDHLRL